MGFSPAWAGEIAEGNTIGVLGAAGTAGVTGVDALRLLEWIDDGRRDNGLRRGRRALVRWSWRFGVRSGYRWCNGRWSCRRSSWRKETERDYRKA